MTDFWLWFVTVFAGVSYFGWGVTLWFWRWERQRWARHRCAAPTQATFFEDTAG
jgi:hypothetical protein